MLNFFKKFNLIKNQSISILSFCIIYAYSIYIKNYTLYNIINADIPKKWQVSFQDPATVSMIGIIDIHHTIVFWLVYIFIVVFFLIAIEIDSSNNNYFFSITSQNIRYSLKECSWLEIFWTTAPSLILFYEILPSVHSIGYGQDRFFTRLYIFIIMFFFINNSIYWNNNIIILCWQIKNLILKY
jgi:hypothetical protein